MATGIGPQLGLASQRQTIQSQHGSRSSLTCGALGLPHVPVPSSSGRLLSGSHHVAGGSRRSGGSGLQLRRFRENDTEFDVVKDIKVGPGGCTPACPPACLLVLAILLARVVPQLWPLISAHT